MKIERRRLLAAILSIFNLILLLFAYLWRHQLGRH